MNHEMFDILTTPWKTAVLNTAVRLNIFTHLSTRRMTVDDLAVHCQAVPHLLKPVLDVCVSMGMLHLENREYYNSHLSRVYFVKGEPRYVGDLMELQHNEALHWHNMHDIVRTGKKPVQEPPTGDSYRAFIKGMNNIGMQGEADALANAVDLSECTSMVDAGGGSGLYSVILCQKYPKLKSTILDVAETLAVTKELIAHSEARERIELQEADITTGDFGENIDVVLLSDVMYDEQTAIPVLENAWNCLSGKGQLIIRGYYSDPDDSKPLFGALFVLNQLIFDPNRKLLTIRSLEKMITDKGFRIEKRTALTERSFLIVASI